MNENTAPAAAPSIPALSALQAENRRATVIITSSPELLPCPVCGSPAELYYRTDVLGDLFVVFCKDSHCAGNCVPEFDTKEAACAAWNDPARRADFRWYKTCCPNCGWSESDEQGFFEHHRDQNLPQSSPFKRLFRAFFARFTGRPFY